MSTSAIPFRPRSVSELVDASFQVLRRNYAQFVMLMGIAYVPWLVISMITARAMFADAATGVMATSFTRTFVMAIGGLIWFSIIDGAMTVAASESYLGQRVDVGAAFGRAFAFLGSLVGVSIMRGIAIVVGFLFFIIPGFYFLARLFCAPAAVVLERLGVLAALGRSGELTQGLKGHVLKTLVLVWVIYLVLSIAATIIGTIIAGAIAAGSTSLSMSVLQVVSAIFTVLIYPLVAIVQTLLYYDLRIRKEGYDIELMARDIGSAA